MASAPRQRSVFHDRVAAPVLRFLLFLFAALAVALLPVLREDRERDAQHPQASHERPPTDDAQHRIPFPPRADHGRGRLYRTEAPGSSRSPSETAQLTKKSRQVQDAV